MTNISETLSDTHAHISYEPCRVLEITGNWAGAADAYLMLFDVFGANKGEKPDDGATPKEVFRVFAATPFLWSFAEPITFEHSCVAVFSSTGDTLTVVTGDGNTGDLFVKGTDFDSSSSTSTEIGDKSTDCYYLDIWTGGAKRLVSAEIVNGSGGAAYIMLFPMLASAVTDPGEVPIRAWPVADGATLKLDMGPGYLYPPTGMAAACLMASTPVSGLSVGEPGAAAYVTGISGGGFTMLAKYRPV